MIGKININGKEYIPVEEAINFEPAEKLGGMRYVIARTYSAGVFAGYLASQSEDGKRVVLCNARRIWEWHGAATLSQLAMDGTSKPDKCKFPCEVLRVELMEVIELLDVTEKARLSIKEVPVWKA